MNPRERNRFRAIGLERLARASERLAHRFDPKMTLGELRTTLVAHLGLLRGERLTVTEIARRAGQSKSSVSRWILRNGEFRSVDHPEDGRSKLVDLEVSLEELLQYVDEIIDVPSFQSSDRQRRRGSST